MRDYMSSRMKQAAVQLEDLRQQERTVGEARGRENRSAREEAERKAKSLRERLLTYAPSSAVHEYLDVTGPKAVADNFRAAWQEKNYGIDCRQELTRNWREGNRLYEQVYAAPKFNLAILPFYSFVVQFTFTLTQAYLSRDEQDFYIIDNPVRKDKISGLPYVASTSWKGSLRSSCWQLQHSSNDEHINDEITRRLFGNDKGEEKEFKAGSLYFFPTFFTRKGLEIINPQDREKRTGSLPILFESVPAGSTGTFTLLYVPFIIEEEEKTKEQAANDLEAVIGAARAMFRVYGFGAKTHSGFGQVEETIRGVLLDVRATGIEKISESSTSFDQLMKRSDAVVQKLRG